jgi:hypothetical protein
MRHQIWALAVSACCAFAVVARAGAPEVAAGASNLMLAPDLSFTDDSSVNFPIRGNGLGAGEIASGRATVIFFGTAHCYNTNREAERFVAFYGRHRDEARFLVVDLDHPTPSQRLLVSRYYHGYIPTLVFLDRSGRVVYDRAGETSPTRGDVRRLESLLQSAQ